MNRKPYQWGDRTIESTTKQRAYILALREKTGMSASEYARFKSENRVDDHYKRDAGRIIGLLKEVKTAQRRMG